MDNLGLFLNYSADLGQRLKVHEVLLLELELRKAVMAVVDKVGPVIGFVPKSGDGTMSLKFITYTTSYDRVTGWFLGNGGFIGLG